MTTEYRAYFTSPNEVVRLLDRLTADGGRYALTIALTRAEVEAAEQPTYGQKAINRFLSDDEYAAIYSGLTWLANEA